MNSEDYSQGMFDQGFVIEITFGASEPPASTAVEPDYEWYRPGFFARLTESRPVIIMLVIAFLLLIVGPSLFYVLHPPRSTAPRKVQGIPALNTPLPPLPGSVRIAAPSIAQDSSG